MNSGSAAGIGSARGRVGAFLLLSAAAHLLAFSLLLLAWKGPALPALPVIEVYAAADAGPVAASATRPAPEAPAPKRHAAAAPRPLSPAPAIVPAPPSAPGPASPSPPLSTAPQAAPPPVRAAEPATQGGAPSALDGPVLRASSGSGSPVAAGGGPEGAAPSGRPPAAGSGGAPGLIFGAGSPSAPTAGARAGGAPAAGGGAIRSGKGYSVLRTAIESRIVYPEDAIRRGEEGEVLLRIRISDDGYPREIRVARSSGARSLDEAARRGVVRAAPLPSDPGWVEVPVLFRLTR